MRDTRSGGSKRVVVKARQTAALNHRQQQIVHTAREIAQATRDSKQHVQAKRRLDSLNLNADEMKLAVRAAQEHRAHLDRMKNHQDQRRTSASAPGRLAPVTPDFTTYETKLVPAGLRGGLVSVRVPVHHKHTGHNADVGDVMLKSVPGLEADLKATQISPVLRGIRTATQDIIGPSITAAAQGEHASLGGLATDAAMLVDPTKVFRGGHAAIEAIRAGEKGVEVLRSAKTAAMAKKSAPELERTVAKWKKTKAGKQAVADFKEHPARAEVHRQIDAHPDLTPAEKRAWKRHVDNQTHNAVRESGLSVNELLSHPDVQPHAEAVLRREPVPMTPEEIVANRIRPRNPGREGLSPTGAASPELRASVSRALESHGVDTSVFRQSDLNPHNFADLIARGEPGRFWYEQSGQDILAAAHGNKETADKIAQLLAVYSAHRAPVENTQLALNAFHEWQRTGKVSSFGTGPQIQKANQILVEGKPWEGLKTDRFYGNLLEEIDPEKYARLYGGGEVTNDIWMARLFGLKTDNPTTREYHAMTGIVQKIADELGWKPKQVQAALWVAKKAEYEGTSVEQAAIDFSTALRSETAHLPFEAAPGVEYAPALAEQYAKLAPEAQRAYTAAKADLVNQFLDEAGIFGRLGHEGVGVYEGQFNPSWTVYMPASRGKGAEFDLAVAPHAREELDAVAAAIGQAFHQDAAAWFKPFYKKSTSAAARNGAKAILGRSMRPEEAVALDERFRAAGQEIAIVHDHDGVHFLNLDSEVLPHRDFHAAVGAQIDEVFGPETRTLLYASDGNYITKEAYGAHLGGHAGGRSDVLRAAADRLEERGAEIDSQFLAERGAGGAGPRLRIGGDGLSSGINPGFHDDTERGLIGDWLARMRGKDEPVPTAAAPSAEQAAKEEVMAGLKKGRAGGIQREQAALNTQTRGERATAAEQAMAQAPRTLDEQIAAAKSALAGEFPKLKMEGLRGLSKDTMDGPVMDLVDNSGLDFYDGLKVKIALRNAWLEGTAPTKSELRLLRKTFGPEITHEMVDPSKLNKYGMLALNIANIPRSLMSTLDFSAAFRQGLFAYMLHPSMGARNMGPMIKFYTSEEGYRAAMQAIERSPNREIYDEMELAITDIEHSLDVANREEAYASDLAERLTGGKYSPVRGAGRAYTGFLVKFRTDMADLHLEQAAENGYDIALMGDQERKKFLKELGHFINMTTGRGSGGAKFEAAAPFLNTVFFSPRLIKSRLNFLNPVSYFRGHPYIRRQRLKLLRRFLGTMTATLFLVDQIPGVDVGLDPKNANFLKIRVGNTRIDISGGTSAYVRMAGQLFETAAGKADPQSTYRALERFFRGKLSPITGLTVDETTDTNYAGMKLKDRKKELYDHFIPLVIQDTRDAMHGGVSPEGAVGTWGLSTFGFGVQTYKDAIAAGGSKKGADFAKKYRKATGADPPAEVVAAVEDKGSYSSALSKYRSDHNLKKTTPAQQLEVKLAILEKRSPEQARGLRGYLKGDNPTVVEAANELADEYLGWGTLSNYIEIANEAKP